MKVDHRTVAQIRRLVLEREDAPAQLLFWLEHVPDHESWLEEAPRPDWIAYLARVAGLGPHLLLSLDTIAQESGSVMRRRGVKDCDDEAERYAVAPLSEGADRARQVILNAR
jgi:hypothetical protein